MVAVSLFDILVRSEMAAGNDSASAERLGQKLIEAALSDWERLKQYELEFAPVEWDDAGNALEITRSIHGLFERWAAEAEQVLTRTRKLTATGRNIPGAEMLEDAYGKVSARLKLTPEMIAQAVHQIRQGRSVPAKELRDELRSRLRA